MPKGLLILATIFTLMFSACAPPPTYKTVGGTMLGTTLSVIADAPHTQGELYAACMQIDREAKQSMSIFDPASLLSRINRGETDSLDRHIVRNLLLADSISRLSEGAYDITVAPLVKAWGFAGKQAETAPNIDSILTFVGYQKIRICDGRLLKEDPRMAIDLNSIAKGYTVDLVAEWLEKEGVTNYLVDIGGEVRCRGVNRQGKAWRIGIETPFDGNMSNGDYISRRISLHEGALATSGNYRRFYLDSEGRKVAHTIDPRTGHSRLSTLLSATVIAPTCAEADALCTMLMALGDEAARTFCEQHPEFPVCLLFAGTESEYAEYLSPAMQQRIIHE